MIKTNMTILGKVFMVLFFFASGFSAGVYYAKSDDEVNSGNKTEISIGDIKGKGDGDIVIDLDTDQEQEQPEPKKEKKFLGIF